MKEELPYLTKAFRLFKAHETIVGFHGLANTEGIFASDLDENPAYRPKLRQEIESVLHSEDFSWSSFAKAHNYVGYHPAKTDEEILLDFQLRVWQSIYPEQWLSIKGEKEVYRYVNEKLSESEWCAQDVMLEEMRMFSKELIQVSLYDILQIHYVRQNRYNRIMDLKHEMGTNDYWFKLKPRRKTTTRQYKGRVKGRSRLNREKKGDK